MGQARIPLGISISIAHATNLCYLGTWMCVCNNETVSSMRARISVFCSLLYLPVSKIVQDCEGMDEASTVFNMCINSIMAFFHYHM